MRKRKWNYRFCGKILLIVLLQNFLLTPLFAEPLTEQAENLSKEGTNYYSDLEVELLIDDLSAIAKEAIEQAGAEAARAAALASIERQAELIQEKAAVMREAERWKIEAGTAKANGKKNLLIGIMSGFLGGLVLGIAGTAIMGN